MKICFLYIFLAISKQKLILYVFFTTMNSDLSNYLNEQLGVFSKMKQQE